MEDTTLLLFYRLYTMMVLGSIVTSTTFSMAFYAVKTSTSPIRTHASYTMSAAIVDASLTPTATVLY